MTRYWQATHQLSKLSHTHTHLAKCFWGLPAAFPKVRVNGRSVEVWSRFLSCRDPILPAGCHLLGRGGVCLLFDDDRHTVVESRRGELQEDPSTLSTLVLFAFWCCLLSAVCLVVCLAQC